MGETGNAPDFDPLNPSHDEERDMMAGYLAKCRGEALPCLPSAAFEHGWRMASNDLAKVVDEDQKVLARRFLASGRSALTAQSGREGRDG